MLYNYKQIIYKKDTYMQNEKNKILKELSKISQKEEKKSKKVMLSFTETEHSNLLKIAEELKMSVPNMLRNSIKLMGITSEEKTNKKA